MLDLYDNRTDLTIGEQASRRRYGTAGVARLLGAGAGWAARAVTSLAERCYAPHLTLLRDLAAMGAHTGAVAENDLLPPVRVPQTDAVYCLSLIRK